jgi:hypothetical protein
MNVRYRTTTHPGLWLLFHKTANSIIIIKCRNYCTHLFYSISFEIVKQICSSNNSSENIFSFFVYKKIFLLDFDEILNDNINEILSTTVHSHFHIQIRLLHSEGLPDQSCKIDDYLDHKPWESAEFHEGK